MSLNSLAILGLVSFETKLTTLNPKFTSLLIALHASIALSPAPIIIVSRFQSPIKFKIFLVNILKEGTNIITKSQVVHQTYREKYQFAKDITAISITANITNVRNISFNSNQNVLR